jgi:hypothetical protein
MVKGEYKRVALPTINTRVFTKILIDKLAALFSGVEFGDVIYGSYPVFVFGITFSHLLSLTVTAYLLENPMLCIQIVEFASGFPHPFSRAVTFIRVIHLIMKNVIPLH